MTKTTKLEEASKRWGGAAVVGSRTPPAPARRRGLAVAFSVPGARVSRVAEQIRDVSQFKLDRSTTR